MQLHQPVENIDSYMHTIEQYPRLTHEQERELAWKIHHGTPEEAAVAKDTLICCNLRLCVAIAHQYKKYHNSLSDLIQEASLGLCVAAEKFDPDRCPKFSLAVSFWAKQKIRLMLAQKTRTVTLPVGAAQAAAKVAKARNAYVATTGREPSDEELASITGMSKQRVQGARTADIGVCSVNDKINPDSDATFLDMLEEEDDSENSTAEDTMQRIQQMLAAVDTLTDMDRFLIKRVYGIGCEATPIEVLTTETGWGASRIRGRLCNTFKKLKDQLDTY